MGLNAGVNARDVNVHEAKARVELRNAPVSEPQENACLGYARGAMLKV